MGSRVPNELWLEIFDHLPLDTIKCLSLTSRTFSPLTRPFLFAHFDFHPYASRILNGVFALPSAKEVEQCLERLAFWASPEIAPFVRSCDITPWTSMGAGRAQVFSGTTTPYVLLAPFFDHLPCFIHVHRLHAKLVHFTQTGVTNLLRLPALATLHIDSCGIAPGEHIDISSLPQLSLSKFTIRHDITSEDEITHWIPLLRREYLRELDAMCNVRLLGETIDDIPSFPHLHSLAILEIRGWGRLNMSGLDVPATGLLPCLKQYTGMIQTLHIFLPLPTLTRLKTYYGNPHLFMAQLDQLPAPSTITSLDVCFDEFDNRTLEKLSAFFTRLVELRIRILHEPEVDDFPDDINPQATSFFKSLSETPTLPPTLKHLALAWEFEYGEFDDDPTCGALPDFGSLRDALLARCPDLAFLWLDGHDFLLRWCKYPDGTVDEHTLADACEVEAMRPELYIL